MKSEDRRKLYFLRLGVEYAPPPKPGLSPRVLLVAGAWVAFWGAVAVLVVKYW